MYCIHKIEMCIERFKAKISKYLKSTKVVPAEEWIEIKVCQ